MPKLNKRTKQSQNAIKKRWKQAENPEVTLELSDAEPDIIDESWFNTFWIEGEETRFDNDEITNGMKELQSNTLEQLIENAKKAHVWNESSRGPVYNGDAQSTLRNKRAYWRKAALGSKKITEMFPTNEAAEPDTNPTFFTFENAYDSSDDDNEFTLESLDSLLKKKKDDLRLQTVSQFLHLVRDHGFTKMDASNLLAQSLNKGPWQARLIRSWANQWLKNGIIVTSKRGRHAKVRSLLLHEDLKLQVTEYLRAHKFKLNVADFVKFIEDEIIPTLGIEEKTSILYSTAQKWLHILSWKYKNHSKNIYFDGHERKDVVADRHRFLE